MSNPTTGFLCQTSPGVYQDLSGIFQPLFETTTLATATGFLDPSGHDLNTIFENAMYQNTHYFIYTNTHSSAFLMKFIYNNTNNSIEIQTFSSASVSNPANYSIPLKNFILLFLHF